MNTCKTKDKTTKPNEHNNRDKERKDNGISGNPKTEPHEIFLINGSENRLRRILHKLVFEHRQTEWAESILPFRNVEPFDEPRFVAGVVSLTPGAMKDEEGVNTCSQVFIIRQGQKNSVEFTINKVS